MKRLNLRLEAANRVLSWLSIGSLLCGISVLGQGTVEFKNIMDASPPRRPVFDVDGTTLLAGPAFLAQLYAAPLGGSLAAVGTPVPFGTGAAAGFFLGFKVIVPTVPALGTAMVQVRAWRGSDGESFELADHVGGHVGMSRVFNVGPLGLEGAPGTPLPAPLLGLQSFSLYVVAEPTALALGLVGSLAFGLRRWARRR